MDGVGYKLRGLDTIPLCLSTAHYLILFARISADSLSGPGKGGEGDVT